MTGLTGSAGLDGSLVNPVESNIAGNVVVCDDWLRYGAHEDWIYLGPGGWSFRHGSNFVERIAAFSSGRIRLLKQGGGDAWIALSAVPVSIVPEANWHRLKTAARGIEVVG